LEKRMVDEAIWEAVEHGLKQILNVEF